jgi:hypothetical protein
VKDATATLANYWHPICRSEDVGKQPRQFRLLCELHLNVPDASAVTNRRLLFQIEPVAAFLP